jgi:hypothetical protein
MLLSLRAGDVQLLLPSASAAAVRQITDALTSLGSLQSHATM